MSKRRFEKIHLYGNEKQLSGNILRISRNPSAIQSPTKTVSFFLPKDLETFDTISPVLSPIISILRSWTVIMVFSSDKTACLSARKGS